jgi:hypothetical protein
MCHELQSPPNSAGLAATDAGLLARLVQASPAVLYSCRVAGDCSTIAVTDNVRAVLGYMPADFTSDPSFWAVRIHPEDSARVFEEMPRLFREGVQVISYRFRHSQGHYVWLRDRMQLDFDEERKGWSILGCWMEETAHQADAAFAARIVSQSTDTTTANAGGNYAKQS